MSILKFCFVLGISIFMAIGFFFGLGSKKDNYIYGGKAARWSKSAQKRFNVLSKWLFRCLSIGMLIFLVYPLARDVPDLISGNIQTDSGIITVDNSYIGQRWLSQSIVLDANNSYHVFFGPILGQGENVTVKYLPHSKFVMDVIIYK